MSKVFFDNLKEAVKVAKNLGTTLDESLSIEEDREKIKKAVKEENIPAKNYSIAETK